MMKNRKTAWVRVRVAPAELLALKLIAQHDARNPSEQLRELIREGAQRRGVWPPVGEVEHDRVAA